MPISHRAGELIALSDGEYSDYAFHGLYRALEDLDLETLAREFIPHFKAEALLQGKPVPEDIEDDLNCNTDSFGAYLIRRGVVEPVDYDEIHCGYSFESSEVIRHARNRSEQLANRNT